MQRKKRKDSSLIEWSDECLKALEFCKESIANSALLAHPVAEAQFSLLVDASNVGIGSVLQQAYHGVIQPLSFFSRKLTMAERKYSTYDRELLAIYCSIRHFRHMIEGRNIVVYTDHKPLTFAFHKHNENASPRQQRHLEYVSQFTTQIKHISGSANVVADAFSRISEIDMPQSIDYEEMAKAQSRDDELRRIRETGKVLKLIPFLMSPKSTELWCDTSTDIVRPYVPKDFRHTIFRTFHNLSHPGVKATVDLVKKRFTWKDLKKDVSNFTRACEQCQKSKVHRHTKSPIGNFPIPQCRFSHVHIDIVGPLPPSRGQRYCLTCIDRFSRWPEVFPIPDQTANTIAETFYSGWISRFGVPTTITSDQGRQFESDLFKSLSAFLGAHKTRTTAYNPAANGMIERFHRQLKSAIRCYATDRWTEVLPTILLGIRSSFKPDIGASSAEMLYGSPLRLPGDFFRSTTDPKPSCHDLMNKLREFVRRLRPIPASRHNKTDIFIHPDLATASHVFIRKDYIRKPLEQPYEGPYEVI